MYKAADYCASSIVGWWELDARGQLPYNETVTQNGIVKGLRYSFKFPDLVYSIQPYAERGVKWQKASTK